MGRLVALLFLSLGLAATYSEGSSSGGGLPSAYYGGEYNNYDASWRSSVGSVENDPRNPAILGKEEENPLPPGWTEYFDQGSGQPYYHNSNDGTTTWDRPVVEYPERSLEEEVSETNSAEANPVDYENENSGDIASRHENTDQAENAAPRDSEDTQYDYPNQQLPEGQMMRTPEGGISSHYRSEEMNAPVMYNGERSPNQKTFFEGSNAKASPGAVDPSSLNDQQQSRPPAWGVPNQQAQPPAQSLGSGNHGTPNQDQDATTKVGASGSPAGHEAPRQQSTRNAPQSNVNYRSQDQPRQHVQEDKSMRRSQDPATSYRGQPGLPPDIKNQQSPLHGHAQSTVPPRGDLPSGPPPRSTNEPENQYFQPNRSGGLENKPPERPVVPQSVGPPVQQHGRTQQAPVSGMPGGMQQQAPVSGMPGNMQQQAPIAEAPGNMQQYPGGQRFAGKPFGVPPQDRRQEQQPAQSHTSQYNPPTREDGPQGQYNAPPWGEGLQRQHSVPPRREGLPSPYNAPPRDGMQGQSNVPPRAGPLDNQRPPPGSPYPRSTYPPSQPRPQNQYGPPGSQRPPHQQLNSPYGQYQQYGAYGQQPRQRSNQLVSEETTTAVRGAIGSAWQGILGFGNRTKEVVETAKSSVVNTAKEASQTISTKSTSWWGQARNSLGSLFESGDGDSHQSSYSLSGDQNNQQPLSGGPGNTQAPGMYPGQQGRYPYPQQQQGSNPYNSLPYPPRYPPQGQGPPSYPGTQGQGPPSYPGTQGQGPPSFPGTQGQGPPSYPGTQGQGPPSYPGTQGQGLPSYLGTQGQPPQGQNRPLPTNTYPPGYRPPQPRADQPYAHERSPPPAQAGQRQQPPSQRQGPPPQTQWGVQGSYPPMQQNWQQQQQQQQYPGGRGQPPTSRGKDEKEPDAWSHPGLSPDF